MQQPTDPPLLIPILLSHPPRRRAKIMSTCSMQKAQSYLPTRQSVLVTAAQECQQEGGVHARMGKKGLSLLGQMQCLLLKVF